VRRTEAYANSPWSRYRPGDGAGPSIEAMDIAASGRAADVRRIAVAELPGVRWRLPPMFRYGLVWRKPCA